MVALRERPTRSRPARSPSSTQAGLCRTARVRERPTGRFPREQPRARCPHRAPPIARRHRSPRRHPRGTRRTADPSTPGTDAVVAERRSSSMSTPSRNVCSRAALPAPRDGGRAAAAASSAISGARALPRDLLRRSGRGRPSDRRPRSTTGSTSHGRCLSARPVSPPPHGLSRGKRALSTRSTAAPPRAEVDRGRRPRRPRPDDENVESLHPAMVGRIRNRGYNCPPRRGSRVAKGGGL